MASFKRAFEAFSKFGVAESDGKLITLSQSDKWMKQAKVFDSKLTTTDTAIHFKKMKSQKLNFSDYNQFLDQLAAAKKIRPSEIKEKMAECGEPGTVRIEDRGTKEVTDRLTDTSKYTGAHKERFDESGRGKGLAGRQNNADTSGYVTGYKEKDTYGRGDREEPVSQAKKSEEKSRVLHQ